MTANIIYDTAFEDTGQIMLARIRGSNGAYVTQAALSSIAYTVTDWTTGSSVSVITSTVVTIATSVFDTLQEDGLWTVDDTGYNFRHTQPALSFPNPSRVYLVTYTATPVSGAVFKWMYQISTREQ